MLSTIKRYLQQRGQASLEDIAYHIGSPPDAVRGMLEQWVRKGKVRRLRASPGCGSSCTQCDPASAEVYQWTEEADTRSVPVHRIGRCPESDDD